MSLLQILYLSDLASVWSASPLMTALRNLKEFLANWQHYHRSFELNPRQALTCLELGVRCPQYP